MFFMILNALFSDLKRNEYEIHLKRWKRTVVDSESLQDLIRKSERFLKIKRKNVSDLKEKLAKMVHILCFFMML